MDEPVTRQPAPSDGETWQMFFAEREGAHRIQYWYRTSDGDLFSTIAPNLVTARARRDAWLERPRRTQTTND